MVPNVVPFTETDTPGIAPPSSAEVTEPDDCFGTGFLSGDPGNPVAKFNYIHLHRSHFAQWASAGEFRAALESFLASDEWEGPKIEFDPMPKWTRPRER